MVWSDLQIAEQLNFSDIARGKREIDVFFVVHEQNFPIEAELCQRLGERFRLVVLEAESIDDVQLILFQLKRQCGFQGSPKHLPGKVIFVVARLRAKNCAAFAPQRVSDLSDAGTAGTLLRPWFFSGT